VVQRNRKANCQIDSDEVGGTVDNDRINQAAQKILDACLSADDPVATLHVELKRLRVGGGWTELELHRLQVLLLDTAKRISENRRADMERPSKRTTRSEVEISEAIQDCVKKCLEHDEPLVCVAACISALIENGWTEEDAKAVEKGSLRVLSTIKSDDSLWPDAWG
jgi:hypothetical protein